LSSIVVVRIFERDKITVAILHESVITSISNCTKLKIG